jgi:predicted nuclease of predicted toxin-antitoxin system
MKFIVDAQLPKRLAIFLRENGFDAIHTLELPNGNKTKDNEIITISVKELFIVISKDADFYDAFFSRGEPYKLIYLKVGNLSTIEILTLFDKNLSTIIDQISTNYVIEISNKNIITIC